MGEFRDLYHPDQPDNHGEINENVEIGPVNTPCAHGNYVVRFYGATFTQSNVTGKVSPVQRHPALALMNAN